MVLRDSKDPLNTSRGIMGPLELTAGVQNNRGRLKQRFDLIRKLGQGTYGKVQLGIDKETGQEVAIKTIKKSKIETEADLIRIRREIQIMSSVRHPNIIHIYEVFENREKMVLVMEYAAGGELYDYLNERKILQEEEARRIFRQIASAVYYCHKNKICHRDLKLENILLDEKANAKIADFGLSNVFDEVNMLKTFCGSPLYASPEIVRGVPYAGPEVDCWSLGVLLYTLVYGAMPFDGSNFKRLVKQISSGDYYEPKKPAEASPLIRFMLTVDPKKRAKVEEICAHQWINQGFQQDCLASAEELALQTPVRIDVLLTLAPNQDRSVIANDKKTIPNHTNKAPNESDSMLNEPPKKAKLQGDAAASAQKEGVPPTKPKRKVQSKSKSKTAPLVLDLIQDVPEEEGEDVEMQSTQPPPAPPATAESKAVMDDEVDTLSEISEIQTLAEDIEAPTRPKERVKSVKGKKAEEANKVPPAEPAKPKMKTEPPPSVPAPQKTELQSLQAEKPLKDAEKAPTKEEPVASSSAEPPKTTVVKKKVVKPKQPGAGESSPNKEPPPTTGPSVEAKKAPEEPPKAPEPVATKEPSPKLKSAKSSSSESPKQSSDEKSDTEGAKKKIVRQRSDSLSDASPTRVERRNSKVISQKTAELIQNLETKTSKDNNETTTTTKPVKKLVIPNFKMSDAKNKFETKPPRPITSSVMSQSKAAFEAKTQQTPPNQGQVVKPEKEKSAEKEKEPVKEVPKEKETIAPPQGPSQKAKSPSPLPQKKAEASAPPPPTEKENSKLSPPEAKQSPAASPKPKAKVVKKAEPNKSPAAVKDITPEPPSISEATVTTTTTATEVKKPEVKPVMMDKGNGGPKPVTMVVKGRPNSTEPPEVTSPTPSTPTPTPQQGEKLLTKVSPQNKQEAAKKISSVINKIVSSSSGSGDETQRNNKQPPTPGGVTHKTEVTFPISAAQSQERMIPIKFEDEEPETPLSPSTSNHGSRNRFPPRFDSFKKFDSASSLPYSRQNSTSDTESCSIAGPPKGNSDIRKCPREFLIPIKLEGSGQTVNPKDEVLSDAGSEDDFRMDSRLRSGRFGSGRFKRYSSILSDSSVDDDQAASVSGSQQGRRGSSVSGGHARGRSQGEDGEMSVLKKNRTKRPDLDRSDSFSSAEEDDEDFFEVFTADSLFSNLLDRVRNLTKKINREGSVGPSWPDPSTFSLWNPTGSLRDLMSAPSESRNFGRSFSREPSVSGSGSSWRRSLSRDVSGESDSSGFVPGRSFGRPLNSSDLFETSSVRSLPISLSRRSPSYMSQRSEPYGSCFSDRDSVTPTPSSLSTASSRQSVITPSHRQTPAYGRTLSNMEFSASSPMSKTLPLRRSLKAFDRPGDYSSSSFGIGQSLIDSPDTFDPESYLRQMRCERAKSVGREIPILREPGVGVREGSVARMSSICEQPDSNVGSKNGSPIPNQSQNKQAEPAEKDKPATTAQDRINNGTQYFQNHSQSPLKRFQDINTNPNVMSQSSSSPSATNPAPPVGIGLARLRPLTMYEPSFNNMNVDNVNANNGTGMMMNHQIATSAGATLMSPKWPNVSVQQYRPLSISSFPTTDALRSQRASSVARILSPQVQQQPAPPPFEQIKRVMSPVPTQCSTPICSPPQTPTPKAMSPPPVPLKPPVNGMGTRIMSPPPPEHHHQQSMNGTVVAPNDNLKNKGRNEPSRATSVERITRFLERKSVPREMSVQPEPTTEKPVNKIGKPKFLQHLEKKWERMTSKDDEPERSIKSPSPRPMSPILTNGNAFERDTSPSTEISPDDNKISESVLLRRALSPEKSTDSNKLKKFGSGTVNHLLGKFKKFEETTPPPTSKPMGKPPVGVGGGRRVVSPYAGATSDSVLTLSQQQQHPSVIIRPNFVPEKSPMPVMKPVDRPTSPVHNQAAQCNGNGIHEKEPLPLSPECNPPDPSIIRSAETAQQKRRALLTRFDTRSPSPAPSASPLEKPAAAKPQLLQGKEKSTQQIPTKMNGIVTLRCTSPPVNGDLSPPTVTPSPDIPASSKPIMPPPPQITIQTQQKDNPMISPPLLSPNSDSTSTTAEQDSSSVGSDNNRMNDFKNSILDEEESVSDRILRKSFYSRFNSNNSTIDRAKRSSSLSAATAARRGISPLCLNGPKPSKSSSHHHHHHHHHGNAKSPTPAISSSPTPTPTPTPDLPQQSPATLTVQDETANANRSPSPHSLVINKYNPNPLFKELITEDFKSDIEKKTEYSRKVTSKLSKLLKEIETDMNTCNLSKKDDEDEEDNDNELGLTNGKESHSCESEAALRQDPQESNKAKKPPMFGVGLKALTAGKSTASNGPKKYGGSKTTNLGGAISALTPNSVLSKRNIFNRESSLQPEDNNKGTAAGGINLNKRASSVAREITKPSTSPNGKKETAELKD